MSVVCVLMYFQVNTKVTCFMLNWLALHLSDAGRNVIGGVMSSIKYYFLESRVSVLHFINLWLWLVKPLCPLIKNISHSQYSWSIVNRTPNSQEALGQCTYAHYTQEVGKGFVKPSLFEYIKLSFLL